LSYKRIVPTKVEDKQGAWDEYVRTILLYLKEGSAVQTWRGWGEYREELDKIYTDVGIRPFWWEGIPRNHRPQQHAIAVVGLDLSKGIIYLNDPGCGWFGKGKSEEMRLTGGSSFAQDKIYYADIHQK
jgi:hypothetical protein